MSDFSNYKPAQSGMPNPSRQPDLSEQFKAVGQDLKEKAAGLTADTTDKIASAVNDKKGEGADYIGNIAQAVHRAAGEFEKDVPQAAQYIRQAADQIETVAKAVRERNVGDLFSDVQQFARRQPTAFFGGAVILGFAAIRFFKSSTATNGQGARAGQMPPQGAHAPFHKNNAARPNEFGNA